MNNAVFNIHSFVFLVYLAPFLPISRSVTNGLIFRESSCSCYLLKVEWKQAWLVHTLSWSSTANVRMN